jgi:predicted MFS family arabinose efflux permease
VACTVALAFACGPLLTGGLSSRLAGLAAPGETAQRRAQGWDAVSYGVGGTAGPAAVAALAGLVGPLPALLALAGAAGSAAALTLTLPRAEARGAGGREALPVRAVLRLIAGHGPLRRVTVATTVTSLSLGAVPAVIAVVLGSTLRAGPGAGAALAAAFGLGNLAGSLAVTVLPLRGEPELLTIRGVVAMAGALALCALAPSYPLALAAFALAGAVNAPFFTATLAARSRYSPAAARAQVFVSMAAGKVAAGAVGGALAAAAIGAGPRTLLAAGAALTLAAAALCAADRRLAAPREVASRTLGRRPAPVPRGCEH